MKTKKSLSRAEMKAITGGTYPVTVYNCVCNNGSTVTSNNLAGVFQACRGYGGGGTCVATEH